MRVGLFGGTFDPVHRGHVALAEAALSAFMLDRVVLMPGYVTPFKQGRKVASAEDRLAMLQLAVAGHPKVEVSTLELERGGVSYTVDTLEALRALHPEDELWLLMGLDSLLSLGHWYRAHDIVRLATVATLLRPGAALPRGDFAGFSAEESAALREHIVDGHCPEISSTDVRAKLRASRTGEVPELAPEVLAYIRAKRLYEE